MPAQPAWSGVLTADRTETGAVTGTDGDVGRPGSTETDLESRTLEQDNADRALPSQLQPSRVLAPPVTASLCLASPLVAGGDLVKKKGDDVETLHSGCLTVHPAASKQQLLERWRKGNNLAESGDACFLAVSSASRRASVGTGDRIRGESSADIDCDYWGLLGWELNLPRRGPSPHRAGCDHDLPTRSLTWARPPFSTET